MTSWISEFGSKGTAGYDLFCLPMAGSGATLYRGWQKMIGSDVNVLPVQLPGRENRMNEKAVEDCFELVDMIYEGIKDKLGAPFSIFGHSMGGILAYELTKKIYRETNRYPDILFMSGTTVTRADRKVYVGNMSDDELADYLENNGGTSAELLAMDEFRKAFFPLIRGDYTLVETYPPASEKVGCPIRAFASREDTEVACGDTERLCEFSDDYSITYYEGGHFFIRDKAEELCRNIRTELDNYIARS